MIHTDDIHKLSEFRQNAKAHLDRLHKTGRVEVLTVNGEPRGVVMTPEHYEEMIEKATLADSLAMIDRSMEDIKAGRTHDAKQAIREIANELGLKLDR